MRGELGVDVSRWQGAVNWNALAAAGVKFAGIRATMGAAGLDEQFSRNWSEAKQAGVARMAYHYFSNNLPALEQVENFTKQIKSDVGELPPVLDIEPTSGQVITSKADNTNEIRAWLIRCELSLNKRPIIYTNAWAWSACTVVPDWSSDYALWLAQYTTYPVPNIPRPWKSCAIWQYTNKGDLGGVSPLDLNRYGPYP
ncbi:plyB-like endolysin [Caudoviricetes sp.]|nr:plyB-like endolysin [Caudoviricetes sp.]UOF81087.1 plyB-like endolysin [Caudoviricetes sp.]UOF82210.1 plyB-like endolysin [Caudoviricetes sp.]UOF82432.1 plyB-like endolysin [Caudoviricetes sp.]UOF82603.1 plyB-like endolysin [Caudoviricetes sp.]